MQYEDKLLLDCDFCNSINEIRNADDNEKIELFKNIFEKLEKGAYVHEYVYEHELIANDLMKKLKDMHLIEILKYDDIFDSDSARQYYEITFNEYYNYLNDENFNGGVFRSRYAGKNMGEIHSLIAAQNFGIHIFLSNDGGAKSLAENKISKSYGIKVYSIKDLANCPCCEEIFDKKIKKAIFAKKVKT